MRSGLKEVGPRVAVLPNIKHINLLYQEKFRSRLGMVTVNSPVSLHSKRAWKTRHLSNNNFLECRDKSQIASNIPEHRH